MANKLGEAKLFFVPYFLWTLICIFVVRSKILSRIVCDPKHDKCDETLDEVTRPYMAGINNRRFIWSEYSMVGITLLPCLTVPYMLAEFLRTKRIRSFGLFESIADEAIVLLNTWKFIFVFAMAMLIERGTGTWTISKAVVFGEKSVVIYRPFTNAMRSVQMAVKPQCTKHDLDLDIAGPGVRLSTYLLLAITNMSLTMGSFHGGITGTKELGICTLLNLFGMVFNLLKLKKNSLSPTETFLIIALMDAQIVSLAATLSSKDVLASRWYVRLKIVCEIAAWLSVLVFGHSLGNLGRYVEGSVCCMSTKEWFSETANGNLDNYSYLLPDGGRECDFPMRLATAFLYCWYSRGVDLAHTLWLAHHHMTVFDSLEKLNTAPDTRHDSTSSDIFASIPATAFGNWMSYFFHPLLVIIAIERHLTAVDQTKWAEWQAWGQSLTLVVCIGGLSHWFYVNREPILYIFTWGYRGAWPSTQSMLPTDIVRSVAMDLKKPYLDREDRHLLATGKVRRATPVAATLAANAPSSQLGDAFGATRPVITRMISADVGDQRLLDVLGTSRAESSTLLNPGATRRTVTHSGSGEAIINIS